MVRFTLRERTAEDAEFIDECFACSRGADLRFLPEPLRTTVLRQQIEAFDHAIARADHPLDRVVIFQGDRVGRLVESRGETVWWILDLGLVDAVRGRGLGTAVLASIAHEGNACGVDVGLHVRRGHRAIDAYRRIGFVETGADELDVEMRATARRIP